jgi:hypothetical protein
MLTMLIAVIILTATTAAAVRHQLHRRNSQVPHTAATAERLRPW